MGKSQFKEGEMGGTKRQTKYMLEYKMEAVRLVIGGQAAIPQLNLSFRLETAIFRPYH